MALTDLELIENAKSGDMTAFETLLRRYEKKLFFVAYRMTGNREDAADLTQEAFIKAYRALPNFRGDSAFQTWLYRIIANVCKDELRKKSKTKTVSLENETGWVNIASRNEVLDHTINPELYLENKEVGENIQKAVNSLDDNYRTTLIMREIQGFSYEEISNILDCSVGTVKSRLSRARAAVKNIFLSSWEHPPKENRQTNIKGGA